MNTIARTIGEPHASQLSERVGGLRLAIPFALTDGQAPERLSNRVGHDLAILLILHLGGSTIYVPLPNRPRNKPLSLRKVARLTLENLSAADVAVRLKCTERAVYRARDRARLAGLLPPKCEAKS